MTEANPDAGAGRVKAVIRPAEAEDAPALVRLIGLIDRESPLSLREGHESIGTAEEMAELIQLSAKAHNHLILVADVAGGLVGYLIAKGGPFKRIAGAIEITVGVADGASGKGIGSGLMQGVERWARSKGFYRLELTVLEDNGAARALYEKCGFALEGRKPHAALIEGQFRTELMMGKLLQ